MEMSMTTQYTQIYGNNEDALWGKFITLSVYLKKLKRSTNNLTAPQKALEQQQQQQKRNHTQKE